MNGRQHIAKAVASALGNPLFRAIAEPRRLEIVRVLLASGPLDLNAIAERVGLHQSVVSRHIKALVAANVVTVASGTDDARQRLVTVDLPHIMAVVEALVSSVREVDPTCCQLPTESPLITLGRPRKA